MTQTLQYINRENGHSRKLRPHLLALGLVGVDDGLGVLVEGVEPLLDRLLVVVDAAGALSAVDQPGGHGLVGDVEVEDAGAGKDLLLELLALGDLARVPVDEEALRAGELRDHRLGKEVEDHELKIIDIDEHT